MSYPFLTGANLSDPDPDDWLFDGSKLAGFKPILGDGSVDFRPFRTADAGAIFTQVANDCVWFDLAQKAWLCSQLHDPTPIPFPSPLYGYSQTVRLMRPDRSFVDQGSACRWAMKVARDTGLVPESEWKEIPENIHLVPPADLIESGSVATIEAFYRIPDLWECERLKQPKPSEQIIASMQRGYPVGCVMKVNRAYAELGKKVWTGPIDDPVGDGYHAQTIGVWNATDRLFGIFSSWGLDTGDEGVYWITEEALNLYTAEFWVVQHAPGDL